MPGGWHKIALGECLVPGIPRHHGRGFRQSRHCPEQAPFYLDWVRISKQIGNLVQLADNSFPSQPSTELVIPVTENPRGHFDLRDFLIPHRTQPTSTRLFRSAR